MDGLQSSQELRWCVCYCEDKVPHHSLWLSPLAEKDWTEEDRAREKVLLQEFMTLIDQRNAIVNCLDEDRQRCHAWDPMGGATSWQSLGES